jgi:hypothetical protein
VRHGRHVGVLVGLGQHLLRGGDVRLALFIGRQALHQGGSLGLFTRHAAVALDVLAERGVGQVGVQLGQAHGQALQLLAEGGFHGAWRWAAPKATRPVAGGARQRTGLWHGR